MSYSFFALIARLKHISRWSLMRNSQTENVQEHSHMTAVIAHALAVIARDVFEKNTDPGKIAAYALFHDASEIFTGDMPTPIKYFNCEIMEAYKNIEKIASQKLLKALPEKLRPAYSEILSLNDSDSAKLIKAADKLAAYIKCLEELKAGNSEFKPACKQTLQKLEELNSQEANYFIEHFIPAFRLTLDELNISEN